MKKVNIKEKFTLFSEEWSLKIIAEANGQQVKLAKGSGELVWHKHDSEDKLLLVFKGQLTLKLKHDEDIVLNEGELCVVPKGIEHCPLAATDTHFLMIEPSDNTHTVDAEPGDNDVKDWI